MASHFSMAELLAWQTPALPRGTWQPAPAAAAANRASLLANATKHFVRLAGGPGAESDPLSRAPSAWLAAGREHASRRVILSVNMTLREPHGRACCGSATASLLMCLLIWGRQVWSEAPQGAHCRSAASHSWLCCQTCSKHFLGPCRTQHGEQSPDVVRGWLASTHLTAAVLTSKTRRSGLLSLIGCQKSPINSKKENQRAWEWIFAALSYLKVWIPIGRGKLGAWTVHAFCLRSELVNMGRQK